MMTKHQLQNLQPSRLDPRPHGRRDSRRPVTFGVLVFFLAMLAVPCIHCFAMAPRAELAQAEMAAMPASEMPADMPADCPMHKGKAAPPPTPAPAPEPGPCADPSTCCLTPGALPPTPQTLDILHASPVAVISRTGSVSEMPLPARQDPAPTAGDERSHAPPAFPLPLRI